MAGTTWTKFFWADWKADPALRICSYAARGLWMDLLSIAADHDPIGYVAVAGRALSATDIARMTGGSEDEVQTLLGELDRNGVFSRDRHQRIYSRRMVRDARKAAIARKNGSKGGNPSLGNNRGISPSVIQPVKGVDKPQEPFALIPEEEPEAKASSSVRTDKPGPKVIWDDVFEAAWKAYPHFKGRGLSKAKTWPIWREQVRLCGSPVRLVAAVKHYARVDKQHRADCGAPAFDRWLKEGRWEHWLEGEAMANPLSVFPEPRIRQAVERAKDEAWAASWLDPCAWDPDSRSIIPRGGFAAGKLRQEVGDVLRGLGVRIVERVAA